MRTVLVALAFMCAPHAAFAQDLPLQLERWVEECSNLQRTVGVDDVVRACTSIVRSAQANSGARAFAYSQRGEAYLQQGDRERALSDFSSAIENGPQLISAYIGRAALYEAQRDYSRAAADYDEVIRRAPQFGAAYNARCWLKVLGGDLTTARADCDRAIAMNVGAPAYDTRGMLNLRSGDFQAAWSDYDMAVQINPRDAHSVYGRGLAASRLGRSEEGRADLEAAAAINGAIPAAYAGYGVTP
jgi:tetratricopeptide (TPR) repeat protein